VAAPVVSGILIIVIVFLPLLTLEGLEGKLFSPVALTIVFALSASLLLSLTVVPVLASFLLQARRRPRALAGAQAAGRLRPAARCPGPRHADGGIGGVSLVAAAGRLPLLGKTFMPTMDEGDIIMQLEKLPSISLNQTIATDLARAAGADEGGARGEGHRRPLRFRRARPRPDGAQPDRHLSGAQAARGMAPSPTRTG
jgi:cobalt-zinc-cadmium resistance protein CzcA